MTLSIPRGWRVRCRVGRNGKLGWESRARPDRENLGSLRDEFRFDSGLVGSHFRFLSKGTS